MARKKIAVELTANELAEVIHCVENGDAGHGHLTQRELSLAVYNRDRIRKKLQSMLDAARK